MQKNYYNYSKEINKFKEEIYFFCDVHIGYYILFPAFMNLWPEVKNNSKKKEITKKDLAIISSKILNELIEKNIIEICDKKRPKDASNVYAFYRILQHNPLIDSRSFVDKKRDLKFK